jgi:hypothetical protein
MLSQSYNCQRSRRALIRRHFAIALPAVPLIYPLVRKREPPRSCGKRGQLSLSRAYCPEVSIIEFSNILSCEIPGTQEYSLLFSKRLITHVPILIPPYQCHVT